MLDTNICIELIRGRGAKALRRLRRCKVGEVGISAITLAELEHGVEKSAKPEQNRLALRLFFAPIESARRTRRGRRVYIFCFNRRILGAGLGIHEEGKRPCV